MIRKGIIVVLTVAAVATSATCISVRHLVEFKYVLPYYNRFAGAIFYEYTDTHSFVLVCKKESILSPLLMSSYVSSLPPIIHLPSRWDFSFLGISGSNRVYQIRGSTNYEQTFSISLWLITLIFAIYPTIAFIHGPLRRYRRRRKGLCIHCGYNLTGNTTGICSECGTTTTSSVEI